MKVNNNNQSIENSSYWINRCTIRKYSSRPIDRSLLEEMILKASHAPTTGNMQLYTIIASTTEEERKALAGFHFNQPQVMSAPVVLTFCADLNRITRWAEERNASPGFDNFQSFIAATLDTVAVAQQFNTIAELRGLGCCWLGTTTYNAKEIAEVLKLPKMVVPIITLTVGYPEEDGVEVGRLPVEAILHYGKYIDNTSERIDQIYYEKEQRSDSINFVTENHKETLAQVFTDIRYPKSTNETFSSSFIEYLKESGLLA